MPLTANFLADFSSFIRACADATVSTEQVEAAGDKLAGSFNESVQAVAGKMQGVGEQIAAFGLKAWTLIGSNQMHQFESDVKTFATAYISDFSAAEAATTRLQTALKNAGQTSPQIAKDYEDMASGLQKISTFSRVAITDAQAIFTTIGKVGPENMQATLEAAMNLAAFMRIDVVSAAKLMEKAAETNGAAIGRLKIVLGDAYVKGMSFNEIVEAIAKKFSGQFAADVNTTAGAMKNFDNQVENVNEEIGKLQAEGLKGLLSTFRELPQGVQTFLIKLDALKTIGLPVLESLAGVAQIAGVLFPAAMETAGIAIAEFLGALISWPVAIGVALALAAGYIYKHWDGIKAATKDMYVKVKGYLDDLAVEFGVPVLSAVEKMYNGIKTWLYDKLIGLLDEIVGRVKSDAAEIVAAFKWMYDVSVGHSIIPDMVTGIGVQFSKLQELMVTPAWDAATQTIAAMDSIQMPNMFSTTTMPQFDARPLPLMFSATSGLTETRPGTQITLNMTGMLGTDDPQTRQIFSDLVSNAVMQGMRGGRLLGTA